MPANFVHLRLHSAYSLAESTLRIKELLALIVGDNQPAAAITDTNNMFGALEFAQTAAEAGVQPIMGAQINLEDEQGHGEIVLLAKTDIGYVNLSKLLSKTLLEAEAAHDPGRCDRRAGRRRALRARGGHIDSLISGGLSRTT